MKKTIVKIVKINIVSGDNSCTAALRQTKFCTVKDNGHTSFIGIIIFFATELNIYIDTHDE
jgi:hypothetical protein